MQKTNSSSLDWPDKRAQRTHLRSAFLDEIARVKPNVLRDLHGEPLSRFRELCGIGSVLDSSSGEGRRRLPIEAYTDDYSFPAEAITPLAALPAYLREWHIDYLQGWAASNNLATDWVFECAYDTLQAWAFTPGRDDEEMLKPQWALSSYGGVLPQTPPPLAGMPEYTPGFTSRSSYLQEVRAVAIKAIESQPILSNSKLPQRNSFLDSILEKAEKYCAEVEAAHQQEAWVRQDELREQKEHVKWAVQFQVLEKSFSEIAETENVSVSTVSRAVNNILELIGLNRRPETGPGRKKGSRTRSPILSRLGK
jgi:hypothetical protein